MNIDKKKIKKNGNLVLLPEYIKNQEDSVKLMFNNVIILHEDTPKEDIEFIINEINQKQVETLILYNYIDSYRKIIPAVKKSTKIDWIITNPIASLTDGSIMNILRTIMEFNDRMMINKIGCYDESFYKVLKKAKYNAELLYPDVNISKQSYKKGNIGIISNDFDPKHGYYNMLTALKLIDFDTVKINSNMPATNNFVAKFRIKSEFCDSISETMKNNEVNLYVNFTNNDKTIILKSLDMGIPCIVGNTELFDSNKKLKELLVLNSDDDVNEIADKINLARQNRTIILKEYEKFRINYSEKSRKQVDKFLK
jgi:hypothetical protein